MAKLRRRQLLFHSVALVLFAGTGVKAQPRTYRVARLSGQSPDSAASAENALFERLAELGYRKGQNLVIEQRFADGRLERLPALAVELAALNPDVIVTGGTQATLAASKATSKIPIVFIGVSDPVGMGVVRSLGRPGTNATGLSVQNVEIQGKRLELLRETFPSATDVAVLHNPQNASEVVQLAAVKEACKLLGLVPRVVEARSEADLSSAFKVLASERPDVLYVLESPFSLTHRARVVESANAARLPALYGFHQFAEAGGLMSYSSSLIEHYRSAAIFIDKILKGASPSELPVEQPTKFELIINLRTAKMLGLKIPQSILLRADRIIE
jgi:putative ABC transport system substrate-binding protein